MSSSRLQTLVLTLGLLGVGACVPSARNPALREASISLPAAFEGAPDGSLAERRAFFGDPQLNALIDQALVNNQELLMVDQEVLALDAEAFARSGEILPRVGLGVGAGVEKVPRYTSQGAADEMSEIEPGKETPETLGDLRVGFRASWEIDLWKRMRNATKAARLRTFSGVEGRNLVVTELVAEVAEGWYALLALDGQREVLDQNISLLEDSLDVVRLQKQAGRVNELAVQRFEAELLENRSRRALVDQRIVEAEARLNLLCGRYPQPIERTATPLTELTPPVVAVGLPAELLENRPDVRAAELELEATKLDVKSARAAFYPSLGIDADVGVQAFALRRLVEAPESIVAGLAGGLVAPLLNRREITADYRVANSRQMTAVLSYERTVLEAYTEVFTNLSRIRALGRGYDLKAQQVERMESAIITSGDLFSSARADYLEVLTTRRDALETRLELIELREAQMGAAVDLYRAAGGGWRPAVGGAP